MPFHHVRAGLLYPDNYLSTSLTEGSEAFQLTSISTEELGGERVGGAGRRRGGGGQEGHRHGEVRRVKCEVLAINVSLCEQCGCGTLVLWGKMFPCSAFVGPFRLSCLGNGISHRTP